MIRPLRNLLPRMVNVRDALSCVIQTTKDVMRIMGGENNNGVSDVGQVTSPDCYLSRVV